MLLLDILAMATESTAVTPNLEWLYILLPSLFGGYGIATIISYITKRKTESETHKLEGTRLGQDIMEKALIRLDKEVQNLRLKDELREKEREEDRKEYDFALKVNSALIRYLTKFINHTKAHGGTVPMVDPADEQYLADIAKFAKLSNTPTLLE